MSWSFPPAHVVSDFFDGAPVRTETIEPADVMLDCAVGGGLTFPCPVNASRGDVLFFPIAESLALLSDVYDWYALSIQVDFPAVAQGSDSCIPQPSVYEPCARDQIATSSGQLGYWRATGGGFEAVPGLTFGLVRYSTGDTMPDSNAASGVAPPVLGVPSDFGTAPEWDLGRFDESGSVNQSLVINPDPLFAVPDDSGNVSGEALWTRSQLAAMDGVLGLFWAAEGIGGTSNIGASAFIAGLTTSTSPPPESYVTTGDILSGLFHGRR